MKKLLLLILIGLVSSCTQFSSFKAEKNNTQKIIVTKGQETVISNQKNATIKITAPRLFSSKEEYGKFYVSYKNKTNKPIEFSTKNIHVTVNNQAQKIYTYNDLYKKAIKEKDAENSWANFSFFTDLFSTAGTTTTTSQHGRYKSTTTQHQSKSLGSTLADHSTNKSSIRSNYQRQLKNLESVLQKNDVKPNETTKGFLYFNLAFREYQKLKFNIKIFNEIHIIEFDNIKDSND